MIQRKKMKFVQKNKIKMKSLCGNNKKNRLSSIKK